MMVRKMQKDGIPMEKHFSKAACDLITGLTNSDPKKRYGCNFTHYEKTEEEKKAGDKFQFHLVSHSYQKGMEDLKKHEFFKDINWESLAAVKCEAPWIPKVSNAEDFT